MPSVILTRNVKEYRQTVPHVASLSDSVLEVGCAWGTTSALIYQYAGQLIAIDKGLSLPSARARHPHIRFEQIDGFDIAALRRLGRAFTKIYVDVSGCRAVGDVIRLISAYDSVFHPESMVVKSTKLWRLVRRCVLWYPVSGEAASRSPRRRRRHQRAQT